MQTGPMGKEEGPLKKLFRAKLQYSTAEMPAYGTLVGTSSLSSRSDKVGL